MAEGISTEKMSIANCSTESKRIEDNASAALHSDHHVGGEPTHPGFPLFVKYLPSGTTDADLEKMFGACSNFRSAFVLKLGPRRRFERGLVIFNDETERLKAWDSLQESCLGVEQHRQIMLWPASPAKLACLNPETVPWEMPAQTQYQKNWADKFFKTVGPNERDRFVPGCIVLLPPWDVHTPHFYIDPRLEQGAFNHPVIVLRRLGGSLYHIVLCSSTVFPERPNRPDEQHRFLEFEHFPHNPIRLSLMNHSWMGRP